MEEEQENLNSLPSAVFAFFLAHLNLEKKDQGGIKNVETTTWLVDADKSDIEFISHVYSGIKISQTPPMLSCCQSQAQIEENV